MRLTLLALALTACGTSPEGASDSGQVTQAQALAPQANEPVSSDLYATALDLPTCDTVASGRLVYVKAAREFQVCADGAWSVVNLKGERGDSGKDGAAGVAGTDGSVGAKGDMGPAGKDGRDGDAGVAGSQGVAGIAGAKGDAGDDGLSVSGSMWFDPIAKVYWTFSTADATFAVAQTVCVNGWHVPTELELTHARLRGICRVAATSCSAAWISDGTARSVHNGEPSTPAFALTFCVSVPRETLEKP